MKSTSTVKKEKSFSDVVPWIVILFFGVFASVHIGMAIDWAVQNPIITQTASGTVEEFNFIGLLERFEYSIVHTPFRIVWSEYCVKSVMFGTVVMAFMFFYSYVNRKNYVSDILYGSSKWGTISQFKNQSWKHTQSVLIKEAKKNLKSRKKIIRKDKSLKGENFKATRKNRKEKITKEKLYYKKKIKRLFETVTPWSELIFSADIRSCIYAYGGNNNILIYGGSGSGKTRGFVMPNILNLAGTVLKKKHGKLYKIIKKILGKIGVVFSDEIKDGCSFVITDPKGEVYRKSRFFLEMMGYNVRCLNLFEKSKTSHYNPLHYIHADREGYDWEEDVLILIDTMIVNLDGGEGKRGNDPFWTDAPIHCLQSLFFLTMYAFPKEEQNMNTVMWLLGQLDVGDDDGEEDDNSPLDIIFESFAHGWTDDEGIVHEGFGEENIAYRTYRDFRTKARGRTGRSIAMTIIAKLQPYNIASVKAMSDRDELMLDKLGEEKTALFVIVPPMSKTFNYIAGMMFQQAFQELNWCANAKYGGNLPINVMFIMDEYANTAVVPNMPQVIAYARSLGIGICPILQSKAQIKGMHEKDAETIMDCCAVTIYLGGIDSEDTLKSFSERLGKGTYDERDTSTTKNGGNKGSFTESNKKVGRELMTPAEIASMPIEDCLVFVKGKKPMYCKKFDYKSHPNYIYTSDYDYELADKHYKGEDTLREEEKQNALAMAEQQIQEEKRNIKSQIVSRMMELDFKESFDEAKILELLSRRYIGSFEIPLDTVYLDDDNVVNELVEELVEESRQKEDAEEQKQRNNSIIQNVISGVDFKTLMNKKVEDNEFTQSEKLEDVKTAMEQTVDLIEKGENIIPPDSTYPQDGETEEIEDEPLWDDEDEIAEMVNGTKRLSTEILNHFITTSTDISDLVDVVLKEKEEQKEDIE